MIPLLYKTFNYFDIYISIIVDIISICILAHILAKQYPIYKYNKFSGVTNILLFICIYIVSSFYNEYKLINSNNNKVDVKSVLDEFYSN